MLWKGKRCRSLWSIDSGMTLKYLVNFTYKIMLLFQYFSRRSYSFSSWNYRAFNLVFSVKKASLTASSASEIWEGFYDDDFFETLYFDVFAATRRILLVVYSVTTLSKNLNVNPHYILFCRCRQAQVVYVFANKFPLAVGSIGRQHIVQERHVDPWSE